MMKYSDEIERTFATLKDFQRATVDHVVDRMSKSNGKNGQNKFLIADEVGLGKTIVAKGMIAKLYEQEFDENRDFNVIYICSNLALAKQNLSKLNPFGDDQIINYSAQDDRLTSLAYEPATNPNKYRLKIRAFTPTTSFDNKTNAGRKDERALLYHLLMRHQGFKSRRVALEWFLKGNMRIGTDGWRREIDYVEKRVVREDVYDKFFEHLKEPLPESIRHKLFEESDAPATLVDALLYLLKERKQNRSFEDGKDDCFRDLRRLIIPELRLQLSHVCKEYLQADLFILDEFQRFSQLIRTEQTPNEGEEIARAIFSQPDARVLLLSATPFKPYTNHYDEIRGEHHYTEFKTVLEFLNLGESQEFWEKLDENNRAYFQGLRSLGRQGDIETILPVKESVEREYRRCIARTERVIVEQHVCNENPLKLLTISEADIKDYMAIDKIILENNAGEGAKKLPEAIEYVKSSPFPLSFLQDYDHHRVLSANCQKNEKLKKLVGKSKKAFIPIDRIARYEPLLPERNIGEPNPKLRLLYDETVRNGGYQLLWIPPSVNYYKTGGAFNTKEPFTKTLIFSSWKLVPRMVSALVSYEAERLSVGKYLNQMDAAPSYFKKDRVPKPLLTFKHSDDKSLAGMNNYMLIYPSVYLANLYNPAKNLIERASLTKIKKSLKERIAGDLKKAGALTMGDPAGDWQKWYWYAVLLLDKKTDKADDIKNWLESAAEDAEAEEKTARGKHLEEIRNLILKDNLPQLGKLSEKQLGEVAEFLANICLGAPGVAAYRALTSAYGNKKPKDSLAAAKTIADGFISLFNKPESIAVVKSLYDDSFYYTNVLHYCIDGNIQSMLDEYVHQLYDSCGYRDMSEAAAFIRDIMKIIPGHIDVTTRESLITGKGKLLRTHYAVPFGTGGNDLTAGRRQIKVREAFNSPFRPFVLTSTSIGQEGLDFHLYCSKIIHWNLPGNPIDLEQREGRIKRYKSLLIRRNVTKKYADKLTSKDTDGNIWKSIFEYAQDEKNNCDTPCDLMPYWHIDDENGTIKSIIPIYPFSKDKGKYHYIKQVLANYRLTFGQPRQEELVYALQNLDDIKLDLKKLLLNLSPILTRN